MLYTILYLSSFLWSNWCFQFFALLNLVTINYDDLFGTNFDWKSQKFLTGLIRTYCSMSSFRTLVIKSNSVIVWIRKYFRNLTQWCFGRTKYIDEQSELFKWRKWLRRSSIISSLSKTDYVMASLMEYHNNSVHEWSRLLNKLNATQEVWTATAVVLSERLQTKRPLEMSKGGRECRHQNFYISRGRFPVNMWGSESVSWIHTLDLGQV